MTLGNGTGPPIDLDDVAAAWWRRPRAPASPDTVLEAPLTE